MGVKETFQRHYAAEYGEFARIPAAQRLHRRPDLCALLYLDARLGGDPVDAIKCAEHDEVYLDWDGPRLETLTEEDVIYLLRCGIRYDSGSESLCMYV